MPDIAWVIFGIAATLFILGTAFIVLNRGTTGITDCMNGPVPPLTDEEWRQEVIDLKCELDEANEKLADRDLEVKQLRLELWTVRKRIRDARKALDEQPAGADTVEMAVTERAG
jgi:hypothetical protein